MYNFLTILLQAEAPQQGSQWTFWIMMILIFVIMWLFMIRPQQKKQKELEKQRNEMQPGDRIVTSGGLHGKIDRIRETTMLIEIAKGVIIEIDKASVFAETKVEEKKKESKKDEKKEEDKNA